MFKRIVNFNSFGRLLVGVSMTNAGQAWGGGGRGRGVWLSKEAQPISPGGSDSKATDTTRQTVYTNTPRAGGGGGGDSRPYNRGGDDFNRGIGKGGTGHPGGRRGGFGNPGKNPENSQGQKVLGDNYSHGGSSQNQWTQHGSYEGRTGRDNDGGQSHDSDSRQEAFPDAYQEKSRGSGPSHENESEQGAHPGACPEHVNESKQGTQPGFSNSDSERNSGRSHSEGNGPTPPPGCYPRSGHESRQETQPASSKGNSDRGNGIGQGKTNDPIQGPQPGPSQGNSGKGGGMGQDQGNGSRQQIQSGSCQDDSGRGKNKGQSSRFHDQGNRAHGYREQQYKGQRQQYYDRDGGYNRQASYDSGYRRDNSDQQWRKRNRDDNEDDVFLSKTLSFLLRHGAEKLKFKLMSGGYLYVDEILKKMKKLDGFTEEDVQRVVAQNDKQRFGLQKEEGTGRLKIRANQGHTVEVEDLELTPITSVDQVPMVLHGTYHDAWNSIQKQGLCRFKRNHIHFAAGEPGDSGVISGMRSSCEVLIIIDLEKALKDGLKFFLSANNVILSPGNEQGYIYPCYFEAVLNRNPRYLLPFDPNIKGKTVAADRIVDEFDKKDKRKNRNKNKKNKESGAPPEEMVGVGDTDLFAEEKHEKKEGEENEEELFEDALETPQNDVPEKWDLDGEVEHHHLLSTNSEGAAQSEVTQGDPESEVSKGIAESKTNQGISGSEAPKGATKSEASNGIPKSKPEYRASRSEIIKGSAKLDTKKGTAEMEDVKPKAKKGSAKQVSSTPTVEEEEDEEEVKTEDVWEEIFINIVEDSVSAVDYILKCKQPLSVICCGERLWDGDGKIAVLVMAIQGKSWFYKLCNSKVDFMEAGKLKQLFSDPELMKIFHDVTWLSAVLFRQNEIVLDGTQVFDTSVVLQNKMLDKNAIDELRLVGFMPARWAQEDSQMDSSKWTQSPLDKQLVNKLIERCKALLEFYRVFKQKKLTLPKKEICEKVNKYVDLEEVREMRKQSKKPQTSTKFNRSTKETRKEDKKGEHGLPVNQAYRLDRENPVVLDYQHQELEEIRSKRKSKRETEEMETIPEPAVDEHEDTDLNLICLDATPTGLKLPSAVWELRDPSEELLLELTLGSADAEDESELCNQDQGGDKVDTLSGSSALTFREKIEETSRPSPLWPVKQEPAPGYDQLHLDPNYFFLGAPSSVMKSHAATVLQQVRHRVLCHKNGRKVEFLSPAGAACVIKRERCALPDGSTYELTSTWIPDPEFKETKEQPSQTEENVIKTTEAEIQCEIMKLSF